LTCISDLSSDLENQVYGQRLVLKAVVRHLKAHLSNAEILLAVALNTHNPTLDYS
jgi:hypothetical protein